MRTFLILGAAAAALAGGAQAAELEIEHAAARVVVIPEARSDVAVTVTPGDSRLPRIEVRRVGNGLEVDGGLRRRIDGCETRGVGIVRGYHGDPLNPQGDTRVKIDGVGEVSVRQLPLITARVPMDADVDAGGAVFGSVGRTQSLKLASSGCGHWDVANVAGRASLHVAGSGDIHAGAAREANVAVAGSGDIRLTQVSGPLEASIAGSGDVRVQSVTGPVSANIAGSGDIVVEQGRFGPVNVKIAGSGDVRLGGTAESVNASVMGSGDVRVASVTGSVNRRVMGSGDIVIGGR